MQSYKVIIIGAGPTGLGAAWRLNELGYDDFCVLEQNDYVGGLSASYEDVKGFTWDFAIHVVHSHYAYVDQLMEKALPEGFLTHERKSWIYTNNCFVPFPFQYNFRHLPEPIRGQCMDGLLSRPSGKVPKNYEEWIYMTAGQGIADTFMVPYNSKIWTIPPSEMSCTWLGDRVPEVDIERVRRNIANGEDDVAWGPNHMFRFPKRGGTGSIWKGMARVVGESKIRLNTSVTRIDATRQKLYLSTGEEVEYDHLISTMPINRLIQLAELNNLIPAANNLRYSHVQVACVAYPYPLSDTLKDKTWIYCPDASDIFYRVTPFSSFSPAHTPDPSKWSSFLCEVATPQNRPMMNESLLAERVLRDLKESQLIPHNPAEARVHLLGAEYGYPIPSLERDKVLDILLPALNQKKIYSRGRFGAWKYEVGNMDHSIMQGVEAVDAIMHGIPEKTYLHPYLVNAARQ